MYSPTELSKIFSTTRQTIYTKFRHKKIKDFVVNTKEGKRLKEEGFNAFQLLMADSKANIKLTEENVKVDTSFKGEYIELLKEQLYDKNKQIERLESDKNKLMEQLERQTKLAEHSQLLLLENKKQDESKSFFQKLFGKN